jgi:hypothetical protein
VCKALAEGYNIPNYPSGELETPENQAVGPRRNCSKCPPTHQKPSCLQLVATML